MSLTPFDGPRGLDLDPLGRAGVVSGRPEESGDEHLFKPVFVLLRRPRSNPDSQPIELRIDQYGEPVRSFVSGQTGSEVAALEEVRGELLHARLSLVGAAAPELRCSNGKVEPMYAYFLEMPGVTEETATRVDREVGTAPIVGLVAHVSGPTAVGWRIIDVWESEEDYHRFEVDRLNPARQVATRGLAPPDRPFESNTVTSVNSLARRT